MLRNSASIYLTVHTRNLGSPWHLLSHQSPSPSTRTFSIPRESICLLQLCTAVTQDCASGPHPEVLWPGKRHVNLSGNNHGCHSLGRRGCQHQVGRSDGWCSASSRAYNSPAHQRMIQSQPSTALRLSSPALSTWKSDAYRRFCFYINYGLEKMIIIQNNV